MCLSISLLCQITLVTLVIVHDCHRISAYGGYPVLSDLDTMNGFANALASQLELEKRCNQVINVPTISQGLLHSLVTSRHEATLTSMASMALLWCTGQLSRSLGSRQTGLDQFLSSLLRMNPKLSQIGLTSDDGLWRAAVMDYANSKSVQHRSDALSHSLSNLIKQFSPSDYSNQAISNFYVTYLWYISCGAMDASNRQIVILFNVSSSHPASRKCMDKMEAFAFYVALPLSSLNWPHCGGKETVDGALFNNNDQQNVQCTLVPFGGYLLGAFKCCCRDNNGSEEVCTNSTGDGRSIQSAMESLVQHCSSSTGTVPVAAYQSVMAKVFLAINICSIIMAGALIFLLAVQRKAQEANLAKGTLIEFGLVGAILMYSQMILEFFPPQQITCCLMTWCRQLGFTVFYGALILMIYSHLVDRRPRRSSQTGSLKQTLLRDISCMVAFTTTGLIAWTMAIYDNVRMEGRATSNICALFKWHFFWHAVEICLLFYGIYLCFKSRTSFSAKRNAFLVAILIELVVTTVANSIRYEFWPKLSPSMAIITSFVQVHLTVTCVTGIILSKHYYSQMDSSKNENDKLSSTKRNQSSLVKLRDRILSGTLDFAELPIADMNPEDIRAELKRVYTQLRMFKLTNMYADNPHIGKKKIRKQSHSKRASISHCGSKSLYEVTSSKADNEDPSGALTSNEVDSPSKTASGDYTVQSAAHNVYLTGGNLSATQRMLIENDSSTQI